MSLQNDTGLFLYKGRICSFAFAKHFCIDDFCILFAGRTTFVFKNHSILKNPLTLFCILSFGLTSLTAQVSEHSLAFGFYNYPSALEKLANGQWVVVGNGTPTPGGISVDTIFAVIFNQKGEILHRKRLALPDAEIRQVEDVVAMPDGGFVISVGLELCDANFNEFAVQRYDSVGQLVWSRLPDNIENLCSRLDFTPDGNLIGTDRYNYVYKLDINDGSTLWRYPFYNPNMNFLPLLASPPTTNVSVSDQT